MTTEKSLQSTSSASSAEKIYELPNSDGEFLNWLADRLVYVYKENPRVDFVLALRRIASAIVPQVVQAPIDARLTLAEAKKLLGLPDFVHRLHFDDAHTVLGSGEAINAIQARIHVAPIVDTVPSGWKLVPIEATENMARAAIAAHFENKMQINGLNYWSAMLNAAPSTAEQASDVRNALIDECRNLCFVEAAEAEKHGQWVAVNACTILAKKIFNLKSATPADKGNAPAEAKRFIEYRVKTSASHGTWERMEVSMRDTDGSIEERVKEEAERDCGYSDHYRGYEWRHIEGGK